MSMRHDHRRHEEHGDHGERGGGAPGKRTLVQRLTDGGPRPAAADDADVDSGDDAEVAAGDADAPAGDADIDGAASDEAPGGTGVPPDELSRLMDESLGFFGEQPVQRKDAGAAAARPTRATGPASIIQLTESTRCSALIGKGAAHGTQVGQYVRVETKSGVPIIGEVVIVFPTRARVQFGMPTRSLVGRRHVMFTGAGPVTSYAAFLKAARAKQAARAATDTARPGGVEGERGDPARDAGRSDVEVRGVVYGEIDHESATVTVTYTIDGAEHELTVVLPARDWRSRAIGRVRASLAEAGLATPPARAVSALMNAIAKAMKQPARER